MIYVITGGPATGKGTRSDILAKALDIAHISTGDILREISKEDSEIGNYVAETLQSGGLVKDEITYQLIKERLAKDDCKNGYIIDGFPRNLEQAKEYDRILDELNYDIGNIILIDIDEEVLQKRVVGRRLCENCGRIYNLNDPKQSPKEESICDACGGKLYQRTDDNIEAFKNRYETYLEKTAPILEYYENKYTLHKVDGAKSTEEVFEEIEKIINE